MPKSGYKSLTIKDEVYDHFKSIYLRNEIELRKVGVTSFAGFTTLILTTLIDNPKAYENVICFMHEELEKIFKSLKL